jgi:hypothetical protein
MHIAVVHETGPAFAVVLRARWAAAELSVVKSGVTGVDDT